jgi:hypothetical protein
MNNRDRPRLIETEEGPMAWCNIEKTYRSTADFQNNKRSPTGFDYRCRYCNSQRMKNPKYSEVEVENSLKILSMLGYDVNSEESINEQFIKKHNLYDRNKQTYYRKGGGY